MFDRLDDTLMRYEEMMNQLSEPDVANDPERFKRLMKEQSDLQPIVDTYTEYKKNKETIQDSLSMLEEEKCTEEAAVMALFTAGAVGMVIAQQASIAGAQGGCQAECGSASAMAAAALVELCGGTPTQAGHACAMAIKNQLGLVCDPVAGLVEIPCIKRNVSGVSIAFTAAEMALAGIESKIPVDECIQAMKSVGDSMCSALKETALGGLAITPTGIQYAKRIYNTAQ